MNYNTKTEKTTGQIICAWSGDGKGRADKANRILTVILIGILVCMGIMIGISAARAEGETEAWVICRSGDWIHVRETPSRKGNSLGRMECGDRVLLDGKEKNGFLHVVDLDREMDEGWIHAGYIVTDEPRITEGEIRTVRGGRRVACRKWIGGPRKTWAKSGTEVKVYVISKEWALTSKGFIRTEYLKEEGTGHGD